MSSISPGLSISNTGRALPGSTKRGRGETADTTASATKRSKGSVLALLSAVAATSSTTVSSVAETKAAEIIQRAYRGHHARKVVANKWIEKQIIGDITSDNASRLFMEIAEGYRRPCHLKEVIMALIAAREKVDVKDNYGRTSLHMATYFGNTRAVKLLLKEGSNVDIEDDGGCTALHFAAYFGYTDIANLLIKAGAIVNIANSRGMTPLHEAVKKGELETTKFLLESGADINLKDSWGCTTLHHAVIDGHTAIVKMLLKAGSKVVIKDLVGWTSPDLAVKKERKEIGAMLRLIIYSGKPTLWETKTYLKEKLRGENYCCPITKGLLNQAVLCEDGHIYELASINNWLKENKTSPMTRAPIKVGIGLSLKGFIMEIKQESSETIQRVYRGHLARKGSTFSKKVSNKIKREASGEASCPTAGILQGPYRETTKMKLKR
ncbi:hypothetical protein DID76_03965 [Candidatus Marinamargulisbacteria bacterium SCGC AG-414-C22]|nr:hypothetical protein DID76_03965 [Candidatus Marinamargulisbacteria bacterium SCGC AG-414-C22]